LDGILLCKKPSGITSNRIARSISKKFKVKVGNTGILDFAASGLLLLVIGKGTKFTQYFQNLDKVYIAVGELGKETDTYDINGDIINQKDVKVSKDKLIEVINSFIGKQKIFPPIYSSKKVNGKRAYRYALKGEDLSLDPIDVNIYQIDIIDINIPFFKARVHCSTGTYIRSLIKAIGEKSDCYAYMYSLERTSIGNFSINESIEYQKILNFDQEQFENSIIPIEKALYFFPEITLSKEESDKFKNGQRIILNQLNLKNNNSFSSFNSNIGLNTAPIKVFDMDKKLIGLAILIENNKIQPKLVL